jgi:hypothetical protein
MFYDWRGIESVREALFAEGFCIERVSAEISAALCGNVFSPEELLAERYARAYWQKDYRWMEEQKPRLPEPPVPLSAKVSAVMRTMTQEQRNTLIDVPILEQKIREQPLLPDDCDDYVMRNEEIRKFILKVASRYGYKKLKITGPPAQTVIGKKHEETGMIAYFWLDGSPTDGGMGLIRRSYFNLRLFMAEGVLENASEIDGALLGGFSEYTNLRGLPNEHYNYRTDNPDQMNFWSEIIKIGIFALVRFLDLHFESLVKHRLGTVEKKRS